MASGDDGTCGLVLGLGCERGACAAEVLALASDALAEAGFPARPLRLIASLDSRSEEPAIRTASAHFGVPFLTFDAVRLEAETPRLKTPSDTVFRHTGCHGVAEGAALAAGGRDAVLIVAKRMSIHATAAVVMVPLGNGCGLGEDISQALFHKGEGLDLRQTPPWLFEGGEIGRRAASAECAVESESLQHLATFSSGIESCPSQIDSALAGQAS